MQFPVYHAIMALSTKAVATPETVNSATGTAYKVKEELTMTGTVNNAVTEGTVVDMANVAKEDTTMAGTVNNAVTEGTVVDMANVAKEDTTMAGTVNNAVAGGMVTQIGQIKTDLHYLSIGELIQKLKKDELRMNLPVQRKPDQWNEKKQSDLITSVLLDFPIPSFCFVDMDGETMVADGIQRITALKKFIDNDLCIDEDVEIGIITDDCGNTHEISGKKYNDLDHELQKRFLDFNLKADMVTGADNDTVSDIFRRLNSGIPLSKTQVSRGKLGMELADYVNELCQTDYIAKGGKYTKKQKREDAPLECLLQGMLLLDNCFKHPDRDICECKNISKEEVARYSKHISKNYSENQKKDIQEVLDYLSEMGMVKVIDKTMMPMLIVMGKLALLNDMALTNFKEWVRDFRDAVPQAYTDNMSSGNVYKKKTIGRLTVMRDSFEEYCSNHGIDVDVTALDPELFGSTTVKQKASKKTVKAATQAKAKAKAEPQTSDMAAPDTELGNETASKPDSNAGGSETNPKPDSNVVDSEMTPEPDSNVGGSETSPEPDSNIVNSEMNLESDSNAGGADTAGNVPEEPQKETTE